MWRRRECGNLITKITYNSLENVRQESTMESTTELDPYKGQSGLVSILHDHQLGELSQNQVWVLGCFSNFDLP